MTEFPHVKANGRSHLREKPTRVARIHYWIGVAHQTLLFFILLFSLLALYLLIYGLILESHTPRHSYGPGDLKELIYFNVILMMIGSSVLLIKWINFQPIRFQFWDDLRFLASLKFDLDKYAALKRMGIQYKHRKRKIKRRKSNKSKSVS